MSELATFASSGRSENLVFWVSRMLKVQSLQRKSSPQADQDSPAVPLFGDLAGELKLGHDFAAFFRPLIDKNFTAEPGAAVRDEDEENPGRYKIIFRTRDGEETLYRGLPPHTPVGRCLPPPAHDPWTSLQDPTALPQVRYAALNEIIGSPKETDAAVYLAQQIIRPGLPPAWRDLVVFALEAMHLPPDLHSQVAGRLMMIAAELRSQPEGKDKVVWSALRRSSSLLPPEKAESLLQFLNSGGSVDTRSVALQCIVRVFELSPPQTVPLTLADRVHAFAVKFLDVDVFAAGEPSLIARNSIAALASTGDPRLQDVIGRVAALARPWLTRRVQQQLAKLRWSWHDRGVRRDHPALLNLNAAIGTPG
ncbi:MAG TPA: hypothetical protein VN688_33445 [Gemmataceae bacterium]|nr:hypothetical protein [Gemmataceae bacterium]